MDGTREIANKHSNGCTAHAANDSHGPEGTAKGLCPFYAQEPDFMSQESDLSVCVHHRFEDQARTVEGGKWHRRA